VKWSKNDDPSGTESPSGRRARAGLAAAASDLSRRTGVAGAQGRARRWSATGESSFETATTWPRSSISTRNAGSMSSAPGSRPPTKKHTDYAHNLNPTMELGYWKWALETAQEWRVRLGMPRDETMAEVIDNLAPLTVRNASIRPWRFQRRPTPPHGDVAGWRAARQRNRQRRHAEHPACGFAKRAAAVERHLGTISLLREM